ncbi:MAG: hypothetical protein NTV34_14690 [Proteobacteria bacterium]|nr:hypothetical protein [Pseudomonadota bacterium]
MADFIFSDASFAPNLGIGVAASLTISSECLAKYIADNSIRAKKMLIESIKFVDFDGENIARLEFLSAICSLTAWKQEFRAHIYGFNEAPEVSLIIDCKAIENLLLRRERLERINFHSAKAKSLLANADLYRGFLHIYDELRPKIHWVKGHSAKAEQSPFQEIFGLVDKEARRVPSSNEQVNLYQL